MTKSIQKKLLRVRPPRVKITYDVHTNGEIEKHELPFIVGIFADLSGDRAADSKTPGLYKERKLLDINQDNFNDVLKLIQPRASLTSVPDLITGGDAKITSPITFSSLDDFSPINVINKIDVMRQLFEQRKTLLDSQALNKVAEIDTLLSKQLSLVMHDSTFQALETTWRGLFYFVSHTETGDKLKLRVFNATLDEVYKDLESAVEFDQSTLFKQIYEAEYGTFGGTPYSLLVGDYALGRSSEDMSFLKHIAAVAAVAHAPFITAVSNEMFGLDSYTQLDKPRDLSKIFEGADCVEFMEFRESDDARYVTLALPRVLMRKPYGKNSLAVDAFEFEEDVHNDAELDTAKILWGNAAYFLAERITNAFALYSWPAAITGMEGGGLVSDLPDYTFEENGSKTLLCPIETEITVRREKELNNLGFVPLCHIKDSNKAAFFNDQTSSKPKKYINDDANANALMSARLPYMLAASRFAHYVKVIMRDKVGSFLTRGNVEAYLNTWIAQYVLLDDNATEEVKAAYPLRAANIVVTDVPGSPGEYSATLFIRPHFQLQELTASMCLVTALPG